MLESGRSYSVRYIQGRQWTTISSLVQPTKKHNLRQCYQAIQYLFLWASRAVGGVSKGVTFIHGGLATVGAQPEDCMVEAYATIGVEPTVSMEAVTSVYHAKIEYAHPDGTQDPEERRVREDRAKHLNLAYEAIQRFWRERRE